MTRCRFTGPASFAGLFLLLCLGCGDDTGEPASDGLQISNEGVVDLGAFHRNEDGKNTAEFEITNLGNRRVTITHAIKNCKCLNIDYGRGVIRPGETCVVRVQVNSSTLGTHHEAIDLTTTSKESPQLRLDMRWQVYGDFVAEPEVASFGTVNARTTVKKTIELKPSHSGVEVKNLVPEIVEYGRAPSLELQPVDDHSFLLVLATGETPGVYQSLIRWRDKVSQDLQLELPINWEVVAEIDVRPKMVVAKRDVPFESNLTVRLDPSRGEVVQVLPQGSVTFTEEPQIRVVNGLTLISLRGVLRMSESSVPSGVEIRTSQGDTAFCEVREL